MSRLSRLLRTALHPVLLLGSGAVWAQSTPPHPPPRQQQAPPPAREHGQGERQGQGLPDSVRRVERQTGGEVLRAEPMQRDGREVYRLKVLTADGRVRVVQDDPERNSPPPPERKGKDKDKDSHGHKQHQEDTSSRDSDEEPSQ
jgi:hypothetical protein